MPTKTLVDTDSVQTLSNKTLDSTNTIQNLTLTAPVINGTVTGTMAILPTGAVTARTLTARFADFINVKDEGAVGDGTTSDQTAIASAITKAVADGREIYWPDGDYLTTGTLANFHSVRHYGPGRVKRAATFFCVDPTFWPGSTNNLYLSTTGNDTNDGLASTEPRLTLLSMGNVIYSYPYANLTWTINLAAGTYNTTGTSFSKPFPSPNRVRIIGPAVSAGVQPTAIIQGTGGVNEVGIYLQGDVACEVRDINFKRFRTGGAVSAGQLSSGIVVDGDSELYSVNVWTDECDQGIYVTNGSQARIQSGRHGYNAIDGAGVQFIRHSKGTVGYGGSAADINGATGVAFIGGSYGVLINEFAMAHVDFCYHSVQTLAGILVNTGRCHSVSSTFNTCTIGIDGRFNANLGITNPTFLTCGDNVTVRSGARLAGADIIANESLGLAPVQREVTTTGGSTQSATPVQIFSRTFLAGELTTRGSGFEIRIVGEVVGNANTKTIIIALGATTLLTATIAAATNDYEISLKLWVHTTTSEKFISRVNEGGVIPLRVYNNGITENMANSLALTVTHQVTNTADLNRIGPIDLDIWH